MNPTIDLKHPHGSVGFKTSGYDVVKTNVRPDGLHVTVTATHPANKYVAAAVEAGKLRYAEPGQYAYTADRFECGCRWIATSLTGITTFTDLPEITDTEGETE